MNTHQHLVFSILLLLSLLGCGGDSAETTTQNPIAIVEASETETVADIATGSDGSMSDESGDSAEISQPITQPPTSMSDRNMTSGGGMMDGVKSMFFGDSADVNFDGIDQNAALSRAARRAVRHAADEAQIAHVLALFPIWDADVNQDGDVWWIDFYSEDGDWLGYAGVNVADDAVFESEMVGFKSEEELALMLPIVETVALGDPQIQTIMGDANAGDWYTEAGYDPYDSSYYYYFDRGLESYYVSFWIDDDGVPYVDSIKDADALEETEQAQWNQDQAVEIAWEQPNLWERFDDIDDWQTFVSPLGENLYAVSFAHSQGEIAYALVNIETREIIEFR